MFKPLLAAAAIACLAPAAPALADHDRAPARVQFDFRVDTYGRDHRFRGPQISRHQAIRIARSYGLRQVRDVDLRRGVWEVNGFGRRGRIEVEINARTGRVIDVDRHRRRGWGRRGRDHHHDRHDDRRGRYYF
ncbi:MAG: PepSY domain-containing protein [Maricaulaceae bacterium]